MTEDLLDRIPGERAETVSGRRFDGHPLVRRGAVAAAMIAFIGLALWSMRDPEVKADAADPERVVIRQTTSFEPVKEEPKIEAPVPEVELPTPVVSRKAAPADDPLLDSARRAPVMAYDGQRALPQRRENTATSTDPDANYLPLDSTFATFNTQREDQARRFDQLMTPTQLEGSRAGRLGNRNFIVAMGASIPCVLETALASDQPGFASCIISRDVLSDNGRVVLMEKGTQVVGEYRGGLTRGQNRLFVLWNRAKTPKGVIITLASPTTDALGRAGMDGYVDSHWWERFGSALLLSIVGDASSYLGSRLQDGDVEAQRTTTAGQQAATVAVEQSINIPPTLKKHQGELVSIFVARDLDFSGVYSLRVIEPRSRIFDPTSLGEFGSRSKPVAK
ncbi:type IV secretion system protein VirB10 [Sinorhizobium americanum]|uniref:type IV secretion system protein VirB10 n=1 Tax=Sinorhizobium americanum TaxID=194963 RepID=UPI000566614C|nr:type IV secretion system protein VirB10 [Sinorhizobium americanum]